MINEEGEMNCGNFKSVWLILTSQLHKPDPVGTLPKPCNVGLIDIEWVIEDLTKSEVQQSGWNEVFRSKRFRLPAPMLR